MAMTQKPQRIDAHVHFWQLVRDDYHWMTPNLDKLYRDFTPADLSPHLEAANVDAAVLVQAAATVAETRFMLDIARETPFVAGVVGWVEMEDRNVAATLDGLCTDPHFKGIRPMIQDIADADWMLRPSLKPAFKAVIEHGLVFDCLVKPLHLENLHQLLAGLPELRAIIDHGGKPAIAENGFQHWARDMKRLAADTSAYCKLSGLITEAGPGWTIDQLRPYFEHIYACFGAQRIIWGSDWPVLTQTASYEDWRDAANTLLNHLDDAEKATIFGLNAIHFYEL